MHFSLSYRDLSTRGLLLAELNHEKERKSGNSGGVDGKGAFDRHRRQLARVEIGYLMTPFHNHGKVPRLFCLPHLWIFIHQIAI